MSYTDPFVFVKFLCPQCGIAETRLKFKGCVCPNCDTEMISDD